ncbi:MAG: DNA adenine methylase, partial [Acidobacteriaceae bacterium]
DRLVLVERDERIARMLDGIINDPTLPRRYAAFDCTDENVRRLLRSEESPFRYLVQTRCKNRAKFNGGFRKVIDERYCRELVVNNTLRAQAMRDRITVVCGDALEVMREHAADPSIGCFCDPPYTAQRSGRGHTLYRHHKLNHNRLFALLRQWRGAWLLTEDNCLKVRRLARCWGFSTRRVSMDTASHIKKTELMIWRKRRIF